MTEPYRPRTEFDPDQLGPGGFYRLLTAVVVPRPIAWVSSTSAGGVDNLAPHSFFTVASVDPPIVQFTSVGRKDSLTNIEASGEFVVSLAPRALAAEVNATGTDFPPGISEFDAVGLGREPSVRVAAPRVAQSPAVLECVLHSTVCFGAATVIFGRVVHAAIHSTAIGDAHPDFDQLQPLSRLGGNEWGLPPATIELVRIPYQSWPGHYRRGDQQ